MVSNPCLYASRYKLYEQFKEELAYEGATLWTIEVQTGDRKHQVTTSDKNHHIQLWTSALPGELWHKENALNVGLAHLIRHAPDARYIGWIDADIKFEPGIVAETVRALQHWDIVQMWSHAIDLGPNNETVGSVHKSYMYCHWHNIQTEDKAGYLIGGHPGWAWAARREALNKIGCSISNGPFIDWGALGSGDRHMAGALIGKVETTVHGDTHKNYQKWLKLWQERAEKNIKRNVGYVPQTIRHLWHGRKQTRGYSSRWRLIVQHGFDPETDLRRDVSGLWTLTSDTPRQIQMRDDFRRYFRSRNEDEITV